ncbi:MAG: UPF0182 family protein, partial [Bacteroidales bacterium]
MYTILYILLLVVAGYLVYRGLSKKTNSLVISGILLALATFSFFWFMELWGEKLWFDQAGYPVRFSKEWLSRLALFLGGAIFGCFYVLILTWKLVRNNRFLLYGSIIAAILLNAFWWFSEWETVLIFKNSVNTGIEEPILNMDVGFYLFSLPFYKALFSS